jgi:hypothetical protein
MVIHENKTTDTKQIMYDGEKQPLFGLVMLIMLR